MTDHHGKTTTGPAVNVRPPTDAKRCHGTNYCAIAQITVNRDNVTPCTSTMVPYLYLCAVVEVAMFIHYSVLRTLRILPYSTSTPYPIHLQRALPVCKCTVLYCTVLVALGEVRDEPTPNTLLTRECLGR